LAAVVAGVVALRDARHNESDAAPVYGLTPAETDAQLIFEASAFR
jgi:hypothetical protein